MSRLLSSFSISLIVSFDAATDSGALSAMVRARSSTCSFSSSSAHHLVDQPDAFRLRRIDPPRGVQNHPRVRRPHQIDQPLHRIRRIGDRQLRRRNAELAVHRGDAQIGLHRDRQPAAQAEAADARDDRLGKCRIFRAPDAGQPVVFLLRVGVRAVLLELADIRARHERLVARAGQDHHAHAVILARTRRGFRPARSTSPATWRCAFPAG